MVNNNNNLPTHTPNVVVENPHVRKVMNWVLGAALVVLPAVQILDALSEAVDWIEFTSPATGVVAFLAGVFSLGVINPNIPKR